MPKVVKKAKVNLQKGDIAWLLSYKAKGKAYWPCAVKSSPGRKKIEVKPFNFGKAMKVDLDDVILCTTDPKAMKTTDRDLAAALKEASAKMAENQSKFKVSVEKWQTAEDYMENREKNAEVKIKKLTDDEVQEYLRPRMRHESKDSDVDVRKNFLDDIEDELDEKKDGESKTGQPVDNKATPKWKPVVKGNLCVVDEEDEEDMDDSDKENDEEEEEDWADKENQDLGNDIWKPASKKAGRKPLAPLYRAAPTEKEELSEFEKLTLKNKMDLQKLLQDLNVAQLAKELKPQRPKSIGRMSGSFKKRSKFAKVKSYKTRSRSRMNSTDVSPTASPSKVESEDEEEEYEYVPRKRRSMPARWAFDPNSSIVMPSDVTPDMINNVVYYVSDKVYNTATGTSCHQCRQKTIDQKTICRSGRCHGVRGAFCGKCLENRYGEDAREALMNPDWICPPCKKIVIIVSNLSFILIFFYISGRDICNCSICRNRDGKGATGPLIWLAQQRGYKSVYHYLNSLIEKKGTDRFDD